MRSEEIIARPGARLDLLAFGLAATPSAMQPQSRVYPMADEMDKDVARFNRWAQSYENHRFQRLIFEPIQRSILELAAEEVPHPRAILDVGCGTGKLLRAAATAFPTARLDGVDAAPEMVRVAQAMAPPGAPVTFRNAPAESLPFGDATFDLVFSTMTFHHWADQRKGIAEVGRVLAPGGRWLLADFIASGVMKYVRRLFRLTRFRERRDLIPMLAAAGLQITREQKVRGVGRQVPILVIAGSSSGGAPS
jgi:ubiquinone/menaquinone biosynthesis C-methylase UbiE